MTNTMHNPARQAACEPGSLSARAAPTQSGCPPEGRCRRVALPALNASMHNCKPPRRPTIKITCPALRARPWVRSGRPRRTRARSLPPCYLGYENSTQPRGFYSTSFLCIAPAKIEKTFRCSSYKRICSLTTDDLALLQRPGGTEIEKTCCLQSNVSEDLHINQVPMAAGEQA